MSETLTPAELDLALAERVSVPCPHCGKSGLTLLFCICQGTGLLWPWREPCPCTTEKGRAGDHCLDCGWALVSPAHFVHDADCAQCTGHLWVPKELHLGSLLRVAFESDWPNLVLCKALTECYLEALYEGKTDGQALEAVKRALLAALR